MSYFASWQEFSAALHASFVGIFRLGPRSPNSKVAQKKKDWHIAFPLFRYLWTPLFRLATRVNKRVYWARRIKRFFIPRASDFLISTIARTDIHIHDVNNGALPQLCVPALVFGQLACGITSQLTPQTFPVLVILTKRCQVRTYSLFVKWI